MICASYQSLREKYSEERCFQILSRERQRRKIIVLYGNCQIDGIYHLLPKVSSFSDKFFMLLLPLVFNYATKQRRDYLKESFWKLCDVFIAQRVDKDNRFSPEIATAKIESRLSKSTHKIWIPNCYFHGYFPQAIRNVQYNVDTDKHISGKFPIGDKFIDEFKGGGGIQYVLSENFFSSTEIESEIKDSFEMLVQREKLCNIKISDYIFSHYREKQLFYSDNHPINEVLCELTKRIATQLDLPTEHITLSESEFTLRGQDAPIYPCVRKYLGWNDEKSVYYANRYYWDFCGDAKEFLTMYAKVCHGVK